MTDVSLKLKLDEMALQREALQRESVKLLKIKPEILLFEFVVETRNQVVPPGSSGWSWVEFSSVTPAPPLSPLG